MNEEILASFKSTAHDIVAVEKQLSEFYELIKEHFDIKEKELVQYRGSGCELVVTFVRK